MSEDVLSLVFDEVTECYHGLEWPHAQYDHCRAAAPFVLSAVCRRWRIITRSQSRHWSYFAFPTNVQQHPMQVTRARLLLELSGDVVVDVILLFDQPDRHSAYDYTDPTLAVIFGPMIDISHRWRNVRLRLPSSFALGLSSALHEQTPRLEALSVTSNAVWDFLPPQAARLSRLYVECRSVHRYCKHQIPCAFRDSRSISRSRGRVHGCSKLAKSGEAHQPLSSGLIPRHTEELTEPTSPRQTDSQGPGVPSGPPDADSAASHVVSVPGRRPVLQSPGTFNAHGFCHRPAGVRDSSATRF